MTLLEPKTLEYYSFGHVYFLFATWQKTMDMYLEDGWHTISQLFCLPLREDLFNYGCAWTLLLLYTLFYMVVVFYMVVMFYMGDVFMWLICTKMMTIMQVPTYD